ncbi:cathepsin B-like [Helicoverpa zea]|uniref:cathepsin B-like n=1 Tax=Helicoverpa zea TaxID=7113 RepID=UPI001F5ABDFB|nr:cathepsin B-like [Helicoverpa zea]
MIAVQLKLQILFVFAVSATKIEYLLSDEFINLINSKQNSWKAGRNFNLNTPFTYIENLMGAMEDDNFARLPKRLHITELTASLPESFDPREKWPDCPSLNEIRDQGACSSCWAVAAVEVMTDRYCIASQGKKNFKFSAHDVLSCCPDCGKGCQGGIPSKAWEYWRDYGIVSGGNYNSNEGCRPYEIPPCEHNVPGRLPPCGPKVTTPECIKACVSSYNNGTYPSDKHHGLHVYTLLPNEDQIKAELFMFGPVESTIVTYADFIHYKQGVYIHTEGPRSGVHSVKILGWGVEGDQKYWLVANSWNSEWGDNGYFKILRGENHCDIESNVVAGETFLV